MSHNTKIQRGWFWPPNSKRAHYFNNEVRALCNGYLLLAFDRVAAALEDRNHASSDNCLGCQKRRAQLPAASTGTAGQEEER